MADKLQAMTIEDATNAENAILNMLLNYPGYPEGFRADNNNIKWNNLNKETSIGIFPTAGGAVYLKKYVNGSHVGNVTFAIVYRSKVTTNKASIAAMEVLKSLAEWLTHCNVGFEDKRYNLRNIVQTSRVYPNSQDINNTDYVVQMQLQYEFIK